MADSSTAAWLGRREFLRRLSALSGAAASRLALPDNHPLSGGAFATFMPGQHSALQRYLVAPEGRIYFAGEHASLTHTWMQGALESGLRAVREMLETASRA